jgi:glucokinase
MAQPEAGGNKVSHVLAIDLGGTKCSAAVIDKKGKIVARRTVPADVTSASAPVLQMVQLAKDLAKNKNPAAAYVAAGVAVPGLVRNNGTVWAPNLPGWKKMPLARGLTRSLGVPVRVESDRNAAVLGECWLGAGRSKSDVIVLMIGTGIGAGILSGGRIIRGAHELSGCAGWLTVTREDIHMAQGCGELESLAAGPAIARAAQQRLCDGESSSLAQLDPQKITAHEVAAAARRGDPLAKNVFNRAGRFLGFAVANLVSLFDPEVIVLGGGMASVADLYFTSLQNAMIERAQPLAGKKVKIVVSKLAEDVNLLGCARLVWELEMKNARSRRGGESSLKSDRRNFRARRQKR